MIGWLLVAQLAVVANGPDTASVCAPMQITAAAQAVGSVTPRLALSLPPGVQLLRTSTINRVEQDGAGRPLAVTEATFVIAASAAGRAVMPGVVATAGTLRAVSAPVPVLVRPDSEQNPLVLVRSSLDDGRHLGVDDTLFVGQQLDYLVDVQLNEAARLRLRRNPTFFPPEMPAVLAYDLAPATAVERGGHSCFATLSYRRALFPLFPGATTIPPATLTYGLPVSMSFFSREERFELRTDSVRFLALEPPAAGRPADYAGAVGAVRATARLDSARARMGDPLVLTVRLEATGNVKLLPRPTISADWATIVLGEERVEVDTTKTRVQGAKEFDWLLTPRRAGAQQVDGVRYPYFDPERVAYDVALTEPISLEIATATLASADTSVAARLSIRARLDEERPPALPARPWFWLLLGAAPVPAALRRLFGGRERRHTGVSARRRLQKAARARAPLPPSELRRLFLGALRERVPSLVAASPRAPLGRQLRRAGVTDATAQVAEALLDRLDAAAFSAAGGGDEALAREAAAVALAVDAEAIRPLPRAAAASAIGLIALLVAGGPLLAASRDVSRAFAEGVRAYESGAFGAAERLFARAASEAPRAADAWANYGTAAWAANDSAHAAIGWQRALRLDPLDDESRERLAAIAPIVVTASGYVPPVPPDALAGTALALWVAAWMALAVPLARRPAAVRGLSGGTIVVAIVTLLSALELEHRLQPRALGVLRQSATLLEDPSPAGAPSGAGGVGEVGRVDAREGEWIRISLDGTRAGWVRATTLIPLDSASPAQ